MDNCVWWCVLLYLLRFFTWLLCYMAWSIVPLRSADLHHFKTSISIHSWKSTALLFLGLRGIFLCSFSIVSEPCKRCKRCSSPLSVMFFCGVVFVVTFLYVMLCYVMCFWLCCIVWYGSVWLRCVVLRFAVMGGVVLCYSYRTLHT